MAPKRPKVPPIRPNSDGTGFARVGAPERGRLGTTRVPQPTTRASRHDEDRPRGRLPSSSRSTSSSSLSCKSTPASSPPAVRGVVASPPVKKDLSSNSVNAKGSSGPRGGGVIAAEQAGRRVYRATVDSGVPPSECRLHPSALRNLAVQHGTVVVVESSAVVGGGQSSGGRGGAMRLFLEAFMSASVNKDSIALSEDTASLLGDTMSVSVKPLGSSGPLPRISRATIECHLVSSSDSVESDDGSPSPASALALRSLFRSTFQNRVISVGFVATLRLAAHDIRVQVNHVACEEAIGGGAAVCDANNTGEWGVLTSGTHVEVMQSTPDSAAAAVSLRGGDHKSQTDSPMEDYPKGTHELIVGEAGTGKSYTLLQVADDDRSHHRNVIVIRAEEVPQAADSGTGSITALREVLKRAKHSTPATVIIDDMHLLCGSSDSSSSGSQWAIAMLSTALCEAMREFAVNGLDVRMVASATSVEALHPSLLSADRFGSQVRHLLPPSTPSERIACLQGCMRSMGVKTEIPAETLLDTAGHAHGFTQRDIHRVVEAAVMLGFKKRGTTQFNVHELREAVGSIHPSALRQMEVSVPEVSWADIGGSDEAKKTLQEVVEWCLGKQSWIFNKFHLTPPKGVLLYGPPGCSKTMLAKALANESRMNFVSVKGPEVFSKWVGDSEKAVRDIFSRARAAAPCVVFIDELDGMCGHRGRGGVSDRVISQFLTELDGLPSAMNDASNALVFVAATNRPDSIDGAVLRPGRIDRRVHVGLPSQVERASIVEIQFKKLPTAAELTPAYIAERTEGYTGAEVVAVVKESAFVAIANDMRAASITCADVDAALRKVQPRVSPSDVDWYKRWPNV